MSRQKLLAAAVLRAAAVGVTILLTGCSGGGDASETPPRTQENGPPETPSSSSVVRATGPGSCAFLSIDDVRQATGAPKVELRQSVGPNGGPGCEWVLGDDRRALQLEFQLGPESVTLPEGEDVAGPWQAAKWVASSRTLFVDANGQVFFVRVSDNDPSQAKDVCIAIAALAGERN